MHLEMLKMRAWIHLYSYVATTCKYYTVAKYLHVNIILCSLCERVAVYIVLGAI